MKLLSMITLTVIGCGVAHAQTALPPGVPLPGGLVLGAPIGVTVVPPPPASFNALTASEQTRAQYAVPPAPDPTVAPQAYNEWAKAVAIVPTGGAPVLTQTNISNSPARVVEQGEIEGGTAKSTSSNWSGTASVSEAKIPPFQVETIIGEFVVPTARQAIGACTGGWVYSFLWPGIDGWNSNDVLQAGVEADAYCSGGTTASYYSAWVEWYPYSATDVSSPAVNPGDLIYIQVWSTSPTTGKAYIANLSTNTSATYALTAPPGTTLVGNSIEWIVERPGIKGSLSTLTNYIDVPWPNGVAWNYTAKKPTYYYEGKPSTGTFLQITMLDNSGNPISAATIENTNFLWFLDSGSACGISSVPC
jgi:Peptidase A4 family